MLTDSPEYAVVAEHYRPHIKAASIQQYSLLAGGKFPSSSELEHVVDQVMKAIKLEIERASDLKQKPNLAISQIVETIKTTIQTELSQKVVKL